MKLGGVEKADKNNVDKTEKEQDNTASRRVASETTGESEAKDKSKYLPLILLVLLLLIIGLIVSIVVVINTRSSNSGGDTDATYDELGKEYYDPAKIYESERDEIDKIVAENDLYDDDNAIAELYKAHADKLKGKTSEDEMASLMLMLDYWFQLMGRDYSLSRKDEIISQFKNIDSRLQTASSALYIMWAGYYYNDYALMEEYRPILYERGFEGDVDYMLERPTGDSK